MDSNFLRKRDYFSKIRESDLDTILKRGAQVTSWTPEKVRKDAEEKVISKISAKICHRYDVRKIFIDILPFVLNDQYNIGNLVQYNEPAYVDTKTYAVDDLVSFKTTVDEVLLDDIYKCTTIVGEPEPFNTAKWEKVTENGGLYVCKEETTGVKPGTDFDYTTNLFTGKHQTILGWDTKNDLFFEREEGVVKIYYSAADRTNKDNSVGSVPIGDQVKVFPTIIPIEQGTDLENTLTGDLTIVGFMPDTQQWSVVATNPFAPEDNRFSLIVDIMIDLVIFHIHAVINYRQIPEFRGQLRDEALDMLDDIKNAKVTPKLPLFHDEKTGTKIAHGSNEKISHTYFQPTRKRSWG